MEHSRRKGRCYCSFCDGVLGYWVIIGSKSRWALRMRRQAVDREVQARGGNPDDINQESSSDELDDGRRSKIDSDVLRSDDLPEANSWTFTHDLEEGDTDFEEEEQDSYDPEVLSRDDVRWLDRCRCLGFNPKAPGVKKAFISGRGRRYHVSYGKFQVLERGQDTNDTYNDIYNCFKTFGNYGSIDSDDSNEEVVFPFHEECYNLLVRHLIGKFEPERVHRDVLYRTLASCLKSESASLDLEYGGIKGPTQRWMCYPGEEYAVHTPGPVPHIKETVRQKIPKRIFTRPAESFDLMRKVKNDPFEKLPYDILLHIFSFLSPNPAISLIRASMNVFVQTRANSFWKSLIRYYIFPWFLEIKPLFRNNTLPEDSTNFKLLFFWLLRVTQPRFGMFGPFIGIANRRRIWDVCEHIAPIYHKFHQEEISRLQPGDDHAKSILRSAICPYMPLVAYPPPKAGQTVFAQFIHSWGETDQKSSVFEAFWNGNGALIGMSINFGTIRRVFGNTGTLSEAFSIPVREWIREILVYVGPVDMLTSVRPARNVWIEGLVITLTSGEKKNMGNPRPECNLRVFPVVDGMHLIGLTGQVGDSGIITRLGILHASQPDVLYVQNPLYQKRHKYLWDAKTACIESKGKEIDSIVGPIWSNSELELLPIPSAISGIPCYTGVRTEMLPRQVLLWAKNIEELKQLTRISSFAVKAKGPIQSTKNDILGIEASYSSSSELRSRRIGSSGPVPSQSPIWHSVTDLSKLDLLNDVCEPWDLDMMDHFEIDGPDGEFITEMGVKASVRTIKLVTNWGREGYIGGDWENGDGDAWEMMKVGDNQVLAGFVVCFGRLEGWSPGCRTYSHWALNEVHALALYANGGGQKLY